MISRSTKFRTYNNPGPSFATILFFISFLILIFFFFSCGTLKCLLITKDFAPTLRQAYPRRGLISNVRNITESVVDEARLVYPRLKIIADRNCMARLLTPGSFFFFKIFFWFRPLARFSHRRQSFFNTFFFRSRHIPDGQLDSIFFFF